VREISAPEPRLKRLQRKLSAVLTELDMETQVAPPGRVLAHGFRKGHSIVTNAHRHVGRRHVLNVDIADFFPSFNFGRVRGFLIKHRDFMLPEVVATLICQISFHKNVLPQGAPTSPVLTNIVGRFLDIELVRLAKRTGSRYSRYADDITFSTNAKEVPSQLAVRRGGRWAASDVLIGAVSRAGFRLNESKTRLSTRTGRQTVTGLTVNAKVNVPASYYRYARSMTHALFATGAFDMPNSMRPKDRKKRRDAGSRGLLRLVPIAIRRLVARLIDGAVNAPSRFIATRATLVVKAKLPSTKSDLDQLGGILSYLWSIKRLPTGDGKNEDQIKEEASVPKGARRLYRDFLFFRYFHANPFPIILTEGPTDVVYLKTAIRRRAANFPILAEIDSAGKVRLKVRFLRHTPSVTELLQLTGGTDPIKKFILEYDRIISRFSAPGGYNPVIIVVDNDDGSRGANKIYGVVSNKYLTGAPMTVATGAAPTRLVKNLYLLSTPPGGKNGESCVEDLFDAETLGTKLDGKIFNYATGNIDTTKEYGKSVFSEKVVLDGQDYIDFSGFDPLLDRISSAILAHKAVVAANPKNTVPVAVSVL